MTPRYLLERIGPFILVGAALSCSGSGEPDGADSGGSGSSGNDGSQTATGGGNGAGGRGGWGGDSGTAAEGCTTPPSAGYDPLASYVLEARAATRVVTSAADSGAGSLRATVESAPDGAIVGFDASLSGKTIKLESTIELTRAITIDGAAAPGLTLDGGNSVQLLHFNGDSPTRIALFSLRLVGGRSEGSGGAISLNGGAIDFEVGGCVFEDNASSEGGAIRIGYDKGTSAHIHDSVFINNDGSLPGGGNGFSGGAVSTSGGYLTVSRCRFEGNQGPTTGAVYTIHSDPIVEDSVFVGNRSTRPDGGSGAFFADGGGRGDYGTDYGDPKNQVAGQITLRRVRFEGNQGAGDDGGAVEAYAYPMDIVTFEGCVFRDNDSNPGRAGGAFIHADNEVHILSTAFVGNSSTQPGAAIWADGDAVYRIENSLFSGNITGGDLGGALRLNISEAAELWIQNSTFTDNEATNGNGVLWMGGERNAHVKNSIFANNTGPQWAQQINFPVTNDGGNILWPDPDTSSPSLSGATVVDPQLGALDVLDGVEVRAPKASSPAIDAAVAPALAADQRGARRDAKPDVGAVEAGVSCKQ